MKILLVRWGLFLSVVCSASAQTAQVRYAPVLNGTVEGSIQQMTAENSTLNGGAAVTGDLLVPGTPTVQLNGNPVYGGTLDGTGAATPTSHKVTLNGSASLRHVIRRTDAVALPVVAAPPAPTGSLTVVVTTTGQSVNWATARDVTLNGGVGPYAVPAGAYGDFTAHAGSSFTLGVAGATTPAVYSFQHLTLNGTGTLAVVGPVIVTLANSVSTNGGLGNPAHPDWLALKFASGGLALSGNASVYGYVTAPSGPVTISGNAQLVGGLIADQLTINGNGLLRLLAPPTTNQPPTVALTAPPDGSSFTAPTAFTLTATTADSDGTVTKVEFFQGTTKLGEDSAAPYEFTVSGLAAGSYSYLARATDNTGSATDSAPVAVTVTPPVSFALPFLAGFEPAEGYALGPVNGQNGWTASSSSIVTDADFASGARSVLVPGDVPPLTLSRVFDPHPGQAVVFVDLFTLPQAAADDAASMKLLTLNSAQVAFVRSGATGRFDVFNGDGTGGGSWQTTFASIPVDAAGYAADWVRVSLRLDYTVKKWDLYVGGVMAAADVGFAQNTQAALGSFTLNGQAAAPTLLDDFLAAFDNPLFVDADHDGMEDAWETAHGLNPSINDRNGDLDGDGLTNIQEYLLGTDPNPDTDSDGLPDRWEVTHGTDPFSNDAGADPDNDGLNNLQEYQRGTDPSQPDTDRDGIKDGDEVAQGTDPTEYYNGRIPLIEAVIGDNQQARPDSPTPRPLVVIVRDAQGNPMAYAPVRFATVDGSAGLTTNRGGMPVTSVTVQASNTGEASNAELFVFARAPAQIGQRLEITATAGPTVFRFSCTAVADVPPSPPLDFQAVENADNTVTYSWSGNPGSAGSMIFRMQNADGTWREIAEIPVAQLPAPDALGRYIVTLPRP